MHIIYQLLLYVVLLFIFILFYICLIDFNKNNIIDKESIQKSLGGIL